MKASPLAQVKDRFGSKQDLVKAIQDLATDDLFLKRNDEDSEALHERLERVSNKKLLHLHAVLTEVKDEFGSRDKLIDAICDTENRKDAGYRDRFSSWSTPRLRDWYRAAKKRS